MCEVICVGVICPPTLVVAVGSRCVGGELTIATASWVYLNICSRWHDERDMLSVLYMRSYHDVFSHRGRIFFFDFSGLLTASRANLHRPQ